MAVPQLLEERIRDLCARAISANDADAQLILEELRVALREQMSFARAMSAAALSREQRLSPQSQSFSIDSAPPAAKK